MEGRYMASRKTALEFITFWVPCLAGQNITFLHGFLPLLGDFEFPATYACFIAVKHSLSCSALKAASNASIPARFHSLVPEILKEMWESSKTAESSKVQRGDPLVLWKWNSWKPKLSASSSILGQKKLDSTGVTIYVGWKFEFGAFAWITSIFKIYR